MQTMACEVCAQSFTYKPRRGATRRYCRRDCWRTAQTQQAMARVRPPCSECDSPSFCKGYCKKHYVRSHSKHGLEGRPAGPTTCTICGATPVRARGWCMRHYQSWLKHGDATTVDRRQGEIYVDTDGYLRERGRGLVHRQVVETRLGRKLTRGELVHHIDGDKTNPAEGNLHLFTDGQVGHQTAHHSLEICAFEFVRQGLIEFNRTTGRYEIAGRKAQIA